MHQTIPDHADYGISFRQLDADPAGFVVVSLSANSSSMQSMTYLIDSESAEELSYELWISSRFFDETEIGDAFDPDTEPTFAQAESGTVAAGEKIRPTFDKPSSKTALLRVDKQCYFELAGDK